MASPSSLCVRINQPSQKTGEASMRLRLGFFACLVVFVCAAPRGFAADNDYPRRQIKIIVPFPGGAGPDQVARLLGKHLQEAFNETVIIDNRAGAPRRIGGAGGAP